MPEPDEYGRIPGVDYSDQTWVIAGLSPVKTLEEAQTLMNAIDDPEVGE